MKKLFLIASLLISSCISPHKIFAAISSQTNWDVATTGVSTNGGGFAASPYTSTPSAPALSLTTGGTIANGTYYCVITYTDAYGETKASSQSSATVSDATNDAILVTSPAASTNAINYKVYMGTVSGGPYYIQNGTGTAVGTNYTRTTTPATTGDQPSRTDYSQQDAAQVSITDGATTGITTQITSVTGGFTQAMIGNLLYIASGTNFTVGYYEIVSVTNSTTLDVDRNCATGAGSGGNIKIGGRVEHPNTIRSSVVAGNIIHIKNGRYVKQGANAYVLTISVAGGNGTPIIWEGYNTAHLDSPTDTTRPQFDGDSDDNGTNDTTNVLVPSAAANVFKYLIYKRASADNVSGSATVLHYKCKSHNASSDGAIWSPGTMWIGCEINNNTALGYNDQAQGQSFIFSYIHDNGGTGALLKGSTHIGTIFETNTGSGLTTGNQVSPIILNCIFHNNTGASSDGVQTSGSTTASVIGFVVNNIATNNGRYGYNLSGATGWMYFDYNMYNGNTNTANAGVLNIIRGNNDSVSSPSFTDAANGDFTLQSGSAALGIGYPQSILGATGDYQWNIGVDQDDNTVGGASTDIFGVIQ